MDLTKADHRPYVDYEVSGIMPIKEKFGFRVTLIYEDLSKKGAISINLVTQNP